MELDSTTDRSMTPEYNWKPRDAFISLAFLASGVYGGRNTDWLGVPGGLNSRGVSFMRMRVCGYTLDEAE